MGKYVLIVELYDPDGYYDGDDEASIVEDMARVLDDGWYKGDDHTHLTVQTVVKRALMYTPATGDVIEHMPDRVAKIVEEDPPTPFMDESDTCEGGC